MRVRPYDVLFERGLTRFDAERIHHAAFRAIRAARWTPFSGAIRPRNKA